MELVKGLPVNSRAKKVAEELPPPPKLERGTTDGQLEPVKKTRAPRKKTIKEKTTE